MTLRKWDKQHAETLLKYLGSKLNKYYECWLSAGADEKFSFKNVIVSPVECSSAFTALLGSENELYSSEAKRLMQLKPR